MIEERLILERRDDGWALAGPEAVRFGLVNDYLGYLVDRNYSPRTVRTYGFGLLAFCRWLATDDLVVDEVTTDVLLRFLTACRQERVAGRPGPNVVRLDDGRRADSLVPTTINLRLAAVSGLFGFRSMRDPDMPNPVPRGREATRGRDRPRHPHQLRHTYATALEIGGVASGASHGEVCDRRVAAA